MTQYAVNIQDKEHKIMLEEDTHPNYFHVEMVELTQPPEGAPDDNWVRYVIGKGSARIEGKKIGSLYDVTQHAENVAESLNSRKDRYDSIHIYRKRK